jgi:hypothetical protein
MHSELKKAPMPPRKNYKIANNILTVLVNRFEIWTQSQGSDGTTSVPYVYINADSYKRGYLLIIEIGNI